MSVYKSKRGESKVQFLETARELELHTLKYVTQLPKRYTFLLGQRLMDLAFQVHEHVCGANSIYPTNKHEAQLRRDEFIKAQCALQGMYSKVSLVYDLVKKNPEGSKMNVDYAVETWGTLLADEAKLIAGALKSDYTRFKDLPN